MHHRSPALHDLLRPGDPCRLWRPAHAEHGAVATVQAILPDGRVEPRGAWRLGGWAWSGAYLAVTEADYRRRRAADPHGWLWPE